MSTVRWGVLGTARIAVDYVMPAIMAAPHSAVVAIASRDYARAKAVAGEASVPRAYGSYAELLDDDAVDCIYVPLPNSLHSEWTVRGLRRGRAVLCEKPMATSLAEAQQMLAASQESGALLSEAFMYRYHPQFTRLRGLLADSSLGEVRMIRGAINFRISAPDIRLEPSLGGGALLDVGCYPLDAMCQIYGAAPVSVQATASFLDGVVGECAAILEFPGDKLGILDCSFRVPWLQAPLEVVCEHAVIRLSNAYNPGRADCHGTLMLEGRESQPLLIPGTDMYRVMIEAFNDAVRGAGPLEYPAEKSLLTAQALDLVQRAIGASRAVREGRG